MSSTDHPPTGRQYTLDGTEAPSRAVYSAVAAAEDCSPLELTPLAAATDPDALDRLIADGAEGVQISFRYAGYEVTVTSTTVRVQDPAPR